MNECSTTSRIQRLLDLLRDGDEAAHNALLRHSLERLRLLARRALRRNTRLYRLNDTDDLLQRVLIRLYRALQSVKPVTVRAYLGLASRQIRWAILDLAAELERANGAVSLSDAIARERLHDPAGEPSDLLSWSDFHEKVDKLPDENREVFDLLLYQGLSQDEAATLLGISLRTLKRRWQRARLNLRDALKGDWPADA
jgi:RNA polymerase sigma-70 factor (ECF subfamily)